MRMMAFQYFGGGFFQQTIDALVYWGFMDAILPFALIFALLYAIMMRFGPFRTQLTGDEKKDAEIKLHSGVNRKVNAIFSLVTAALVVVPHIITPGSEFDYVPIINSALPQFALLLLAIVLVLTLVGVAGVDTGENGWMKKWAGWLAMLILAGIFINALAPGFFGPLGWWLVLDPGFLGTIIAVLVFGLIVWYVIDSD